MAAGVSEPQEQRLREFMLGTLAPDCVEQVEAALASDPSAPEVLRRLAANDPLTADLARAASATSSTGEEGLAGVVDRLLGSVLGALATTQPRLSETTPPLTAEPGLSPAGAEHSLPTKLGSYQIVREIGRGGMGIVLEAHDEELDRRVAIKVLGVEWARHSQARERFKREARSAAALEHENVAPIYHVGEESGTPYLVMPLLRGETLEARLARIGPLPAGEVIRLGREVAAGLAAAHARGLVHRDVKPANIWLDADTGKTKLLDFGLARAADGTDALTAPGGTPGTPAYMAPEQVEGRATDARSDLFSLGATLYQCATGRKAFAGPTTLAVLRAVADHHPPPPHLVAAAPRALSDLIMRLLAKDPEARPRSAREIAGELAALSDQSTEVALPPAGVSVRGGVAAAPATRRNRRALALAAGAIVLLAAGGWLVVHPPWQASRERQRPEKDQTVPNDTSGPNNPPTPALTRYRGQLSVLVERQSPDGGVQLLRLSESGALPLRKTDKFRIEGKVDPPAYLYVVWVDPGHDVTPVYPWDAKKGWGSRPAREEPLDRVSLPANRGNRYTAPDAKSGVATMVLFARTTPLDAPDEEVRKWFEGLPDLPLPAGGEQAAVWFDDYVEVRDPERPRTFGEVGSDDAFAQWQGQLQKVLGDRATFQTAVSFARTGRK